MTRQMFCAYRREDAASRGLTGGFGTTEDLGEVRLKTSRGKQLGSGCEAIVLTQKPVIEQIQRRWIPDTGTRGRREWGASLALTTV